MYPFIQHTSSALIHLHANSHLYQLLHNFMRFLLRSLSKLPTWRPLLNHFTVVVFHVHDTWKQLALFHFGMPKFQLFFLSELHKKYGCVELCLLSRVHALPHYGFYWLCYILNGRPFTTAINSCIIIIMWTFHSCSHTVCAPAGT